MYLCAIHTENEDYRKSRLSRDLANTSKGSHGLYTEREFSKACKYKIMHTPPRSTLKNKLVPEEAIQHVSMVLWLEYLVCWEAWLTTLLSGHSSTAGQLSAQSQGCLRILCWHAHEKFRNFLGVELELKMSLSYRMPSSSANQTPSFSGSSWPPLSYLAWGTAQPSGSRNASSLTLFASHLADGKRLKCQHHL